jgi:hypothetical protein
MEPHQNKCAIPLVTVSCEDETVENPVYSYKLEQNAKEAILRFQPPLHILSIVGIARRGKSTLVNMLLQKLGEPYNPNVLFKTLEGTDVCTYGIWMYNYPIPHHQEGTWLIIDTEGTDRNDDRVTQVLSAISTFISSHLIFNVDKDFGNSNLGALEITNKLISLAVGEGSSFIFPEFSIVMRNLNNSWINSLGNINPDEYLENNILSPPARGKDRLANVRTSIKKAFSVRRLCLVSSPSQLELDQLPKLPDAQNTSSFSTTMNVTLDRIQQLTKPKRLGQALMTSDFLIQALETTIDSLQKNQGVTIPGAEYVHKCLAESFCDQAFQKYTEQAPEEVANITRDDIIRFHETAKPLTLNHFNTLCEKHSISVEFLSQGVRDLTKRMDDTLQYMLLKLSNKEAMASIAEAIREKQNAESAAEMARIGAAAAQKAAEDAVKRSNELQEKLLQVKREKDNEIEQMKQYQKINEAAMNAKTEEMRRTLTANAESQKKQLDMVQHSLQTAQSELKSAQAAAAEANRAAAEANQRAAAAAQNRGRGGGGWCIIS